MPALPCSLPVGSLSRSKRLGQHSLPLVRCMSPLTADCVAKVQKLPGNKFPATRRTNRRPAICVASITLPKSPVSSSSGDEVPHIFTRKSRLQPGEFLVTTAKGLLQQYRHKADIPACLLFVRFRGGLCCKSRKLQGDEFFAKTRNRKQSPIRIASLALPRSPVSLT